MSDEEPFRMVGEDEMMEEVVKRESDEPPFPDVVSDPFELPKFAFAKKGGVFGRDDQCAIAYAVGI